MSGSGLMRMSRLRSSGMYGSCIAFLYLYVEKSMSISV
jgi:hypothetical protein